MSLVSQISDLASRIASEIKTSILPRLVPAGGSIGQVLSKSSANDYALQWVTPAVNDVVNPQTTAEATQAFTHPTGLTFYQAMGESNGSPTFGYFVNFNLNNNRSWTLGGGSDGELWFRTRHTTGFDAATGVNAGDTDVTDDWSAWLRMWHTGNFNPNTKANVDHNHDSLYFGKTSKVITITSSAAGGAGLNVPHGVAPTSPVNGDLWSTTSDLAFRLAGSSYNVAFRNKSQTWSGKQTMPASSSGTSGFNIPHGTNPTNPVDGDIWTTSGSGLRARIGGATRTFWHDGNFDPSTKADLAHVHASSDVSFNASLKGVLTATTVQAAIDEVTELATSSSPSVQLRDHGGIELVFVSATQLAIQPKGNGRLIVNGESYPVPNSGFTYTNLAFADNTLSFIYASVSGSTLAYEVSTTAHEKGADGVEVKIGDPTRTLIGAVYRTAGNLRDDIGFRGVANWFHRKKKLIAGGIHAGSTPSTTTVGVTGIAAGIVWAGETLTASWSGTWYVNTVNATVATNSLIDGTINSMDVVTEPNVTHYGGNTWGNGTAVTAKAFSYTGAHTIQGAIRVNQGWVYMYGTCWAEVWL